MKANFTVPKARTQTLVEGVAGKVIRVSGGEFAVKSSVSVKFSHDPDAIDATTAARPSVPPGEMPAGEPLTITTSANTQVKGWLVYELVAVEQPAPEPEPEPEPVPDPPPNTPQEDPTPVPPIPPNPTPVPTPSDKPVLGPANVTYLGMMLTPERGVYMSNAYGSLTGRVVDGQVRLLMVGSRSEGDPVYEFADTGTYSKDVGTAPRMSLVREWGDVYGACRTTWTSDGAIRDITRSRFPGALHWSERTQLLYWTYVDSYNTTAEPDWCLGASRLSDAGPQAFGPWRPAGERIGPWTCIRVAEHPVSGELLCGSGVMSGNHSAPWGPDLWAGPLPTDKTPAGFDAPNVPLEKYVTYYPMFNSINRDGSFSGPLKACRRGDYLFEPILGDSIYVQIDPAKNNGVGSWSEVDGLNGSVWIDLPNAHGMLFTGRLAAKHIWYRNAGQGNDTCTHGLPSPVGVTGGVSTDAYPVFIFYNPTDLAKVRAGQVVDYTVDPSAIVNVEQAYGVTATAPMTELTSKNFGGCYFDQTTRKLYVAAPNAELYGIDRRPVVHVFQVAA